MATCSPETRPLRIHRPSSQPIFHQHRAGLNRNFHSHTFLPEKVANAKQSLRQTRNNFAPPRPPAQPLHLSVPRALDARPAPSLERTFTCSFNDPD